MQIRDVDTSMSRESSVTAVLVHGSPMSKLHVVDVDVRLVARVSVFRSKYVRFRSTGSVAMLADLPSFWTVGIKIFFARRHGQYKIVANLDNQRVTKTFLLR